MTQAHFTSVEAFTMFTRRTWGTKPLPEVIGGISKICKIADPTEIEEGIPQTTADFLWALKKRGEDPQIAIVADNDGGRHFVPVRRGMAYIAT